MKKKKKKKKKKKMEELAQLQADVSQYITDLEQLTSGAIDQSLLVSKYQNAVVNTFNSIQRTQEIGQFLFY